MRRRRFTGPLELAGYVFVVVILLGAILVAGFLL